MKSFSDFNIEAPVAGDSVSLIGEKIKMAKLLGKEIQVVAFKIEDSKIFKEKGDGKCLHMQVMFNGENRVVFTSALALIRDIRKIDKKDFPFKTTVISQDERFIFT